MLSLTLFDNPYRVIVCSAATSSDKLLHALKLAKPLFISAFSDQSIEAWILREKQLVLLISEAQNKELCAIREPIASILCHLKQQTGIRFYTAISTLADQTEQAAAAYTDALRSIILSHIWTWKWCIWRYHGLPPKAFIFSFINCIWSNDYLHWAQWSWWNKKMLCPICTFALFYTTASAWFYPRHVYSRTDKHPCALSCKTHRTFTRRAYTPDDVLLCHTITELIEGWQLVFCRFQKAINGKRNPQILLLKLPKNI